MKSSGSAPLTGAVDVDECAIGGKDTGSQGLNKDDKKPFSIAIEILDEGKWAELMEYVSSITVQRNLRKYSTNIYLLVQQIQLMAEQDICRCKTNGT